MKHENIESYETKIFQGFDDGGLKKTISAFQADLCVRNFHVSRI